MALILLKSPWKPSRASPWKVSPVTTPRSRLTWALIPTSRSWRMMSRPDWVESKATCQLWGGLPPERKAS